MMTNDRVNVHDPQDPSVSHGPAYAVPWRLLTPTQVAYLASDVISRPVELHDGGQTRGSGHEWTFTCMSSSVTLLHAPEGRPLEWTHPDGSSLVGSDIVSAIVNVLAVGLPTKA